MWDDSAKILSQSLPREAIVSSSGTDIDHPLFDVVHPAFPLPTTASPTLPGELKDGFVEAVVARDMPEPCECLSPDSWLKRFRWAHKEGDLLCSTDNSDLTGPEEHGWTFEHAASTAWSLSSCQSPRYFSRLSVQSLHLGC